MESAQTFEEIVSQGRQLLAAGDKANALVHFVTATQLEPDNEHVWGLRAEAADDPEEAAYSLEQVLEINPQNTQAREKLIFFRTSSLQHQAQVRTSIDAQTRPAFNFGLLTLTTLSLNRATIIAIVAIASLCVVLSISVPAIAIITNSAAIAPLVPAKQIVDTPTEIAYVLPPAWTPTPTRPPTLTPIPTSTPFWTIKRTVNVRSGPGTTFPVLGSLNQNSAVVIVGRSADGTFVQIQYPDENKLGWVSSDYIDANKDSMSTFAIVVTQSMPSPTRKPVTAAAPAIVPTATPMIQIDFVLGRPAESIGDCSKPWKVLGTIYDSPAGAKRLNGILVRVSVAGQVQGIATSGTMDYNLPGYWEWSFNRSSEISGEVAIVNADGSLRSQPASFRLTSRCDGAGAANQVILDFVGKQ